MPFYGFIISLVGLKKEVLSVYKNPRASRYTIRLCPLIELSDYTDIRLNNGPIRSHKLNI